MMVLVLLLLQAAHELRWPILPDPCSRRVTPTVAMNGELMGKPL